MDYYSMSSHTNISIQTTTTPTQVSGSPGVEENLNVTCYVVQDFGLLFDTADMFLNCFLIHALSFFGIFGNIINIIVLSHHGFKDTTNIILTSLSTSDLLYSLVTPARRLKCVISQFNIPLSTTVESITTAFLFAPSVTLIAISMCHITLIAVERLIAVSLPFHVSRLFTTSRVKRTVFIVYFIVIVMSSPVFMRLSYEWVKDEFYNAYVAVVINTRFYQDNLNVVDTYSVGFLNMLFSVFTLIIILFCSFVIIVKLRSEFYKKQITRSMDSSKSKLKEMKVFKMLLTVCLVSAVVWVPTAVLDMLQIYGDGLARTDGFSYLAQSVNCVLYQFSCSVNFVIYVTTSSKFSATYRHLFKLR
ncbi:uncharacterized protein LOC131928642 [Physella acuta]|uniref:uncharacterized protein LOC131928642 n=1 Tax=Physella acuta TaxID=109671 RepID=UPI0027DCCE12|nr:uncharacterized protein LOC131928642 [Physella acuta]